MMAERYGGKYSPAPRDTDPKHAGPRRPFEGKRRSRIGARSNLLFVAPVPLALRAFFAEPTTMAGYLGAFGLLELAAWLTREGLRAEEEYDDRTVARRPALPRKILGAVLTGAGLALAGLTAHGALAAAIFAALGIGLHLAAFGPDPLKNKGMDEIDEFQLDRVTRAVAEGEKHLAAMSEAIARTQDRALIERVRSFTDTARTMFRRVEDDPRDLSAARKYLGVYLMGARDATLRFATLYDRNRDASARADYIALLDDLQANFAARTQTFLIEDRSGLDIEISVLRERLAREGIVTE